jgi:hypothetical protein
LIFAAVDYPQKISATVQATWADAYLDEDATRIAARMGGETDREEAARVEALRRTLEGA